MDDLRRIRIQDLKEFFEKQYTPGNTVISVVGDIDYDKTLKLLDKYYGSIKSGKDFLRKQICK
ncbi:MAG: insulinase family protein [Ignavibacteria bacterium]|nr:insulinase family protein [Ignavibacteria bacterium]